MDVRVTEDPASNRREKRRLRELFGEAFFRVAGRSLHTRKSIQRRLGFGSPGGLEQIFDGRKPLAVSDLLLLDREDAVAVLRWLARHLGHELRPVGAAGPLRPETVTSAQKEASEGVAALVALALGQAGGPAAQADAERELTEAIEALSQARAEVTGG